MNRYRVEWTIDAEGETPEAAAREAFRIMQKRGTTATVFDVMQDDGTESVRVDLEELDQEAGTLASSAKPDLLASARAEPEQLKWRSEFEGHIQSARDNFADDDLEIDDTPLIAPGVDGSGVWVSAWVWVESNQEE